MSQVSTVYLTGPFAPGGVDWHKGFIRTDANGVHVSDNEYSGPIHFYPMTRVQRVQWGTGW
jgi:hypothetical protein